MLSTTRGIVLRSVKYGETSLISTIFTEAHGIQAYLVRGIRSSAKSKQGRAGLLQPATLLDLVVYHKPQVKLQTLKEFQPAYIYQHIQEEVVKNSVALFSAELLLRLLPEHAPIATLFEPAFQFFQHLDATETSAIANFPIYFTIQVSKALGYEIGGNYSAQTPHINLREGSFTAHAPALSPYLNEAETKALDLLLRINDVSVLPIIEMNATMRNHVLDWYLEYLHMHTQHLGSIRSLAVLRAVLH